MLDWLRFRRNHLLRRHGAEIDARTNVLLPPPYDPVKRTLAARGIGGELPPVERDGHAGPDVSPWLATSLAELRKARGLDGAVAALDAALVMGIAHFDQIRTLDAAFYGAMSELSNTELLSLGDLSRELGSWAQDGGGLTEAALRKLAGHMGEQYVSQHLEAAGSSVAWPEHSNQAGWDLLVDGHEVNIKLYADATNLSHHFANYPNISVIIPGDSANIPESAIRLDPSLPLDAQIPDAAEGLVLVDTQLNHAEALTHAEAMSDSVLDGTDLHPFPVVTAIRSTLREIALLATDKTDVPTAGKNLAADIIGSGGGLALATLAADLLTTGGIGTAITLVGGAVLGRTGANIYKERELRKAEEQFHRRVDKLKIEGKRLASEFKSELLVEKALEQTRIRGLGNEIRNRQESQMQRLMHWLKSNERIGAMELGTLVRAVIHECDERERMARESFDARNRLVRFLWPSIKDVAAEQACRRIGMVKSAVAQLGRSGTARRAEVYSFMGASGFGNAIVSDSLAAAEVQRRARESTFRKLVIEGREQLLRARHEAFSHLSGFVTAAFARMNAKLKPFADEVETAAARVRRENERLGRA